MLQKEDNVWLVYQESLLAN